MEVRHAMIVGPRLAKQFQESEAEGPGDDADQYPAQQ
jgi:hypothetical protein